ncbi:MAG: hypothetical protein A3G81_12575 [Betaproteobacteria bacterium RIFCSPLOWO2_12_FULL_65_14]|nr:MAG: hypothetical protein A3G81_12575 [Betaproteobacteria bacterium RIFCSPLOWO2_12_FULL_65_14]
MKLPRDVSGAQLSRQTGSPIRLTCEQPKQRHITIPNHDSLRIGTLAAILADVGAHHGLSREVLVEKLFGR